MRAIVLLTAAALSFATCAESALAQSNPTGSNSAPQPGLPPGAAIGTPNAPQPLRPGEIATTRVGPSGAVPMASSGTAAMPMHHPRRHVRHRAHPVRPMATPATAQ